MRLWTALAVGALAVAVIVAMALLIHEIWIVLASGAAFP
jgi:hypothetical protein